MSCLSMPKSWLRWTTRRSSSSKVPGSRSLSMRSRAGSFPSAFWRSRRSGPPPDSASRFLRLSSSSRSRLKSAFPHLLRQLLPVLQEFLQADVGERMLDERLEDGKRHGRDVGPQARGLDHVQGIPDAGGQDLALEVVVVEDGPDLAHDLHAYVADVVEPADERAHERRPRLRRQERLRRREDEGRVDRDPLRREGLDGAQTLADHRDLDDHVGGPDLALDLPALADHLIRGGRDHLGADRAGHDGADLPHHLEKVAPLLGHQGGVGGHAVQNAPRVRLPDLLDVRCVEKDLHASSSPSGAAPFPPVVSKAPPIAWGPAGASPAGSASPSATRATATTVSPSSRWMRRTPCVGRPRIEM